MALMDIFRLLGCGPSVSARRYVFNRLTKVIQSDHRAQFSSNKKSLPTYPVPPFGRFVGEFQSDVLQKYPNIDRKDLLRHLSVMWYKLSDEQRIKYSIEYRTAKQEYIEKLGPDEKEELLANRRKRSQKKERRKLASKTKLQNIAYDKPRKPLTPYLLFVQSKLKEEYSQVRQPGEAMPQMRELVKSLANEWKRLDDDKKVTFKERAAEMNREYESKLKMWENDMVRRGRWDLLPHSKQLNLSTVDEYLQAYITTVENKLSKKE